MLGQALRLQERRGDARPVGRRPVRGALRIPAAILSRRAAEFTAAIAAMALYLPSLGYGFVFDDWALIAADGSPVALGGALPYRPLRYASYLLDAWIGGTPVVYHAHNVLLHGVVAALVVALARRLGSRGPAALAGGLLVACHPFSVEAAAYVAGRRDLLCVALGLGSVLAHLSGRLVFALVLLAASVSAKESGLVFIAPLAAASLAGLGAPAGRRCDRKTALAFAAGISGVGAAWVVAYGAIGPWLPAAAPAGFALPGRMGWHYATGLLAVRSFAPEYPQFLHYAVAAGGDGISAPAAIAGTCCLMLAALGGALACATAHRRRPGPPGVFVFAWAASTLVAVSLWGGLHEPGADRHGYLLLPSIGVGISLAVSSVVRGGGRARAAVALATVVLMLATLAPASSRQMRIWQSEASLWSHAAHSRAASPRAHANLARELARRGDYSGAAAQMNLALTGDPLDPQLYLGRAAVRCAQGRRWLARRDLRAARHVGAAAAEVADLARECPLRVFAGAPESSS